jgi:hypothetical protein
MACAEQDARDLQIINRRFRELNKEADDVLSDKAPGSAGPEADSKAGKEAG